MQKAAVEILNAIYEQDFLDCSYGFRPGRSPHQALDELRAGAQSRKGAFTVHVRTMGKRLRRGLNEIAQWCQAHRHEPVDQQQKTLNAKLRGHNQYYGRPTNYRGILKFYWGAQHIWRRWLSRRTRGGPISWEKYNAILRRHPLLSPRIMHPG